MKCIGRGAGWGCKAEWAIMAYTVAKCVGETSKANPVGDCTANYACRHVPKRRMQGDNSSSVGMHTAGVLQRAALPASYKRPR